MRGVPPGPPKSYPAPIGWDRGAEQRYTGVLGVRRAKITLNRPVYRLRDNRRVQGLNVKSRHARRHQRRYYTRSNGYNERASEDVLEGIARALQLDEAERTTSSTSSESPTAPGPSDPAQPGWVRPRSSRSLDAMSRYRPTCATVVSTSCRPIVSVPRCTHGTRDRRGRQTRPLHVLESQGSGVLSGLGRHRQ